MVVLGPLKVFLQNASSFLNPEFRQQWLFTLTVNLVTFAHGIALGWVAPTLLTLMSKETPVSFTISVHEASWIGSLIALGSVFGTLISCNLINIIGRKICLFAMAIPQVCHWILVYFAPSVEYLYVGRFIGGLTSGAAFVVTPIVISEIADASMRGTFSALITTAMNFGTLIGFILSTQVNYYTLPCIVIFLPILFFILLAFFPDTPQYLLKKHQEEKALESLRFYKNYSEITPKCQQDFDELKAAICCSKVDQNLSWQDCVKPTALRSFATSLVLMLLHQVSGISVFIMYITDIFKASGAPLAADNCTIIVGIVQLLGNIAATILVDRIGRKVLMIMSIAGVTVGLAGFGCYTQFDQLANENLYNWLPLALAVLIVFAANLGIGCVTVVIIIEILPSKLRSIGLSVCMVLLNFFVFAALKVFPIYMHAVGISMTMFTLSIASSACLFYLTIFLKETRGKSMNVDE